MVYCKPPPHLILYGTHKTANDSAEQLLMDSDMTINALKENLALAQNWMKKQADLHCRELNFQVGDEVCLKLSPYQQRSLARSLWYH